jgi:hypothetical protein
MRVRGQHRIARRPTMAASTDGGATAGGSGSRGRESAGGTAREEGGSLGYRADVLIKDTSEPASIGIAIERGLFTEYDGTSF